MTSAATRLARFKINVDVGKPDECWEWKAYKDEHGYGRFGRTRVTHISLELDGRPRPKGLIALHSCDNPPCCNPKHLRWGTAAENSMDAVERKRHGNVRKTHCVRGHPYSGDNLMIRANGKRRCKECRRIEHAKQHAARFPNPRKYTRAITALIPGEPK